MFFFFNKDQRVTSLKEKLDVSKHKIKHLEIHITELVKENTDLKNKEFALGRKLSEKDEELAFVKEELERSTPLIEALKKEITELKNENIDLEIENYEFVKKFTGQDPAADDEPEYIDTPYLPCKKCKSSDYMGPLHDVNSNGLGYCSACDLVQE